MYHLENSGRFSREIGVTIEHGHGSHLANEMASVAYWYGDEPRSARDCPPVRRRLAVRRDSVTACVGCRIRRVGPARLGYALATRCTLFGDIYRISRNARQLSFPDMLA